MYNITVLGGIAQLARVLDWQSRGRGFESLYLHQRITVILIQRNDGYFIPKNRVLLTFEQSK